MKKLSTESWKSDWLATPYYGFASAEGRKALVLPRYQRAYVWNEERRRLLIDSIKRDYPIGALILRKTHQKELLRDSHGTQVECEVYEVIDGLQRATSLIFHQLHPLQIVSAELVEQIARRSGLDLSSLANLLSDSMRLPVTSRALSTTISAWARECTKEMNFASSEGTVKQRYYLPVFNQGAFSLSRLQQYLATTFDGTATDVAVLLTESGYGEMLEHLLRSIKTETAISNSEIPVIIWDGPSEDAADIFFRVNQGGMKLSKYQVMAAAWAQKFTDIQAGEVAEASRKVLLPAAGAVVIKKTSSEAEYLDLYEALVGMSHLMQKRFPTLFKSEGGESEGNEPLNALDSDTIPHYAFNIASLVCKTKLSDMKTLGERMLECDYLLDANQQVSTAKLWLGISQACTVVSEALLPLKYAFGKTNQIAHSEQALAALIARYAIAILKEESSLAILKNTASKVVPGHYLNDVIGGITTSHGTDAAAFNRVWVGEEADDWATEDSAFEGNVNSYYMERLSSESLAASLDKYWLDQLGKKVSSKNKGRPTIDIKQKLVLKFIAARKANWAAVESAEKFHIDHSVPFSVVKRWSAMAGGAEYIGGSIANLAILPSKMNLTKSALTVDAWLREKNSGSSALDAAAVWSLVPYKPGQLDIPLGEEEALSPAEFEELLIKVWEDMKQTLVSSLC